MRVVHNENHVNGYGQYLILALHICASGWNSFICSWKCFIKLLISYWIPLIKILMLMLRGLDLGVPSSVRFLKIDLSSRALPIFYEEPFAYLIGSLERGGGRKIYWCASVYSVIKGNPYRGLVFP